MTSQSHSAFILRISPSHIDRVSVALESNQIMIGWAHAEGLLRQDIKWEEFRDIVKEEYYSREESLSRAGNAAGHLWRFLWEMKIGDKVVVPSGPVFYVAEVQGEAIWDPNFIEADTAYRRPVKWLNNKRPIPRIEATSALISRMKIRGTCADAHDLVGAVEDTLKRAENKSRSNSFAEDLQRKLIDKTLDEIHEGRIDSYGFEKLIQSLLLSLGAQTADIVPRQLDKGVDIRATFRMAGTFTQVIGIQAKHFRPDPPVGHEVVDQLASGMAAEGIDLGMVITSGKFEDSAATAVVEYAEKQNLKIELLDGEEIAKLMVENGIKIPSEIT